MNYGTDAAKTETLVGSTQEVADDSGNIAHDKDGNVLYERVYATYQFDGNENEDGTYKAAVDEDGTGWWTWTVGGEDSETVYYMPTFNRNKDSLVADINGVYEDAVGGISDRNGSQYTDYTAYDADSIKTVYEIYDGDVNSLDELTAVKVADIVENGENSEHYDEDAIVLVEDATHQAETVGATNGLISMADWLALGDDDDKDNYWVYDEDGWVYWSSPIKAGETTGLLLDGIELSQVMDDTWYYAINVVAQFITADDLGAADGTGFYDTSVGTVPSDNALTLLEAIGVDTDGAKEDEMQTLTLTLENTDFVSIQSGESIRLEGEDGADMTSILVDDSEWNEDSEWTYDPDTQILTIYGTDSYYEISDAADSYLGNVYVEEDTGITDQPLDITITYSDGTLVGTPPQDPSTGEYAEGVTQIFALQIENKDLYLNGTLTLDDGTKLSSTDGDFAVTFTLDSYGSDMNYTFGSSSDDDDDTEYTFTISTINDEGSEYNGYKVVTCDQTGEKMMVLNETTGHMVMLAEDQPTNQYVYVTAHATYDNVEYTSVEGWELFFVNRDINLFIFGDEETTLNYGATYTPGETSTYHIYAQLLLLNEEVDNYETYPVTWKVVDANEDEVDEDEVKLEIDGYNVTVTVSDTARSEQYTVIASYDHQYDDVNKGVYTDGWTVTSDEYIGDEGDEDDDLGEVVAIDEIGNERKAYAPYNSIVTYRWTDSAGSVVTDAIWSVSGNTAPGTGFEGAELTISADERAESIIISAAGTDSNGEAITYSSEWYIDYGTWVTLAASSDSAYLAPGDSITYTLSGEYTNSDVEWKLVDSDSNEEWETNAQLTVAEGEGANSATVTHLCENTEECYCEDLILVVTSKEYSYLETSGKWIFFKSTSDSED